MELEKLAQRALELEAMRQIINEEAWEARVKLETAMCADGVIDEDAWCAKAIHITEGDITPEFSREGFHVWDHKGFEEWAARHGFARLGWIVDEEAALAEMDEGPSSALYEGEVVESVHVLMAVPNGVSIHPTKATKQIVKEWISEHLHQTAEHPA